MNRSLLLITGASGTGKSTLMNALTELPSNHFVKVRSHTTRPKRGEDDDGHFFIEDGTFNMMVKAGIMAEHNTFGEHQYGVPWESIHAIWDAGKIPVMVLEPQGVATWVQNAAQMKAQYRIVVCEANWEEVIKRLAARVEEASDLKLESFMSDLHRLLAVIAEREETSARAFVRNQPAIENHMTDYISIWNSCVPIHYLKAGHSDFASHILERLEGSEVDKVS